MKIGFGIQTSTFPPGRVALPVEFRNEFKRERMALAVAELAHRVGVHKLSVNLITAEAKMSRGTFYELFKSREEAVGYAANYANGKLRAAIQRAADGEDAWPRRVESVVAATCETVAAAPQRYELSLLEGCAVDANWTPFDPDLVQALTEALRPALPEAEGPGRSKRTDELSVYGLLSVIVERLRRGEADGLPALTGELAELVRIPYLGPCGVWPDSAVVGWG
jgi:AcrR family transcriptional regulator